MFFLNESRNTINNEKYFWQEIRLMAYKTPCYIGEIGVQVPVRVGCAKLNFTAELALDF